MMSQSIAVALLMTLAPPASPSPDPALGPGDVVWAQLDALRDNDKLGKDAGIAVVFGCASPGNRGATGPLDHFTQIVKGPAYAPMIGHRVAGAGALVIAGNVAAQRVTIVAADGRAIEYEFRLSKDPGSGCWFTDGVVPVPETAPKAKGTLI